MKFGMMYEMQLPEPHTPDSERRLFKQVMAQVELADEMGYDYVWFVEHHFLKEFAHSSAPEVMFAALSQRTKNIRFGHGVVLLPYRYNHPIRVAERAAALDILSDGRVDLGTGRSVTLVEMDAFEIDPEETDSQWEEAVRMIPRMWLDDPFSHDGHYFRIPPRSVIPKPVQKPHPPMWTAGIRATSFNRAGKMGLGVLCHSLSGPTEVAERVTAYREGIAEAEPIGAFVNEHFASVCMIHCGENDQEAKELAAPQAMWSMAQARKNYGEWDKRKVIPDSYKATVARRDQNKNLTAQGLMDVGGFAMGDPDTCIDIMKRYEAVGVDQVLTWMQLGGLPHTNVMDSIRNFGEYVMPHFK